MKKINGYNFPEFKVWAEYRKLIGKSASRKNYDADIKLVKTYTRCK